MFCNRCGTAIPPNLHACPNCRRPIGDLVGPIAQSRLENHLRTLAVLWMVLGGLFLIPAALLMFFGSSIHVVLHDREPWANIVPFILFLIGGTLIILATGGVCVGLGLMQRRSWARISAIVLGVLALFHPPFGTALGIYTLWVLLADEDGTAYHSLAAEPGTL
jgi:hypothetical protein